MRRPLSWRRPPGELADRQPGQHRERGARADAADLQQLAERVALALAWRSRTAVRVLAHDADACTASPCSPVAGSCRTCSSARRPRRPRPARPPAPAADASRAACRSGGRSYQSSALRIAISRAVAQARRSPCPPCAWQMAHASASAASALGSPGARADAHHLLHLLLRGLALADHRLLHLQRGVLGDRQAGEHRGARSRRRAPVRAAASIAD